MAPRLKFQRSELFAELDKIVRTRVRELSEGGRLSAALDAMTVDERRALLLSVVEGFSVQETAEILSLDVERVEDILRRAETALSALVATSVLIIEDEALISYQLSKIIQESGHSVAGIAATHDEAVKCASERSFGLILSDIRLADGSSGIEAVRDIQQSLESPVPAIYITAYPEMLLRGEANEPSYLIPKPFAQLHVQTVIDQALLSVS